MVQAFAVTIHGQQVGDLEVIRQWGEDDRVVGETAAQFALDHAIGFAAGGDPEGIAQPVDGEMKGRSWAVDQVLDP